MLLIECVLGLIIVQQIVDTDTSALIFTIRAIVLTVTHELWRNTVGVRANAGNRTKVNDRQYGYNILNEKPKKIEAR